MRVYISIDMEGIAGVVHEDQTNPIEPRVAEEYGRFRRVMTAEANAAIEGALEAGATEIVVNDSHWDMRNLMAEELHPAAELVSGSTKPRSMMEGIDRGFEAAFCLGYHAMAGTPHAILDHTYTDRIQAVRLNGRAVGELGLNAALAGRFGVGVALVSGDAAFGAEARALLGERVTIVVVKEAVARHGARCLAPERVQALLRKGAAAALKAPPAPWTVTSPAMIEVDFGTTHHADMAELVPGAVRLGGRTLKYSHDDYAEAFRAFRAMYNLASVG
jgi:D-amino peptidase